MNEISSIGFSPLGGKGLPAVSSTPSANGMERENYDRFQLSQRPDGMEKRVMELTGRIAQQIKTHHTTGEIAALTKRVRQGDYRPDAGRIAARMLHMREGEE